LETGFWQAIQFSVFFTIEAKTKKMAHSTELCKIRQGSNAGVASSPQVYGHGVLLPEGRCLWLIKRSFHPTQSTQSTQQTQESTQQAQ